MALSIKSLTGLRFSCHDLFSCFSLKTNYHYTLQYPKIYQPGLHALKKYASGPSFSLLRGRWLRQGPFSCFGHKTNYPYRWRFSKSDEDKLSGFARNPNFQSHNQIRQHLRQLLSQKPTNACDPPKCYM